MRKILVIASILMLMAGCGQNRKKNASNQQKDVPTEFPSVSIPSYITGEAAAVDYMAAHYWDKFDFSDASYIDAPQLMEQSFANYVGYLRGASDRNAAVSSLRGMYERSRPYPTMHLALRELADKYLLHPGAPTHDFVLYSVLLEADGVTLDSAVDHFWDGFNFADTAQLEQSEIIDKDYVRYIGLLYHLPDRAAAAASVGSLYNRASVDNAVFEYFWDLADKYLYYPNSQLRDEDLYIVVLEAVIANPSLDDLMKLAPQNKLELVLKNRVGHAANNFTFTTSDGKAGSLYGIKADYLVVFFYNLGCQACKEVREHMLYVFQEPGMAELLRTGKLKVLALYPDEDMTEWDKYVGEIPSDWINAYDGRQDINNKDLYNLNAIPSLYLLDVNKKVLLKDFIDSEMIYYEIFGKE